jgi:hypothetical protein
VYPVVADVNGDKQANIIVTSGVNGMAGVIDVFSTASFPWAPSREVWNQPGYNITNISDSLTIPITPQDNSAVYPNGKRIFNNFLQQSTIFDDTGEPVFPAVDVKITFVPNATDPATGYAKASTNYFSGVCENSLPVSASLTIPLVNNGNIPTPQDMPISIYRGDPFSSASAVLVQTITVANPIPANGGTFTTSALINTTGFTTPFKLYAIPGDPGASTGFPLNFTTYFQDLGFCASQANNAVYGEFSCTCPVITNILSDDNSPTVCGGIDGSIKICGLTPNSTGNIIDFDKNGVAQPTLTNQIADASGCLSLTGLSAGLYNNIRVSNAGCTAGSNLIGPITLANPAPPAAPVPSITSLTICTGEPVAVNYTTTPAGQTVQWSRLPEPFAGLGNFIDFPTATGTDPVSYTYTAKVLGVVGCESDSVTTIVVVNPKPIIQASQCSQTICSGQTGVITFISNIPNETIHWTRVPTTPAPSSGVGDISESFTNTNPTSLTYTYTIWAEYPASSPSCPTSNTLTCTIVVTPGLSVSAMVAGGSIGCIGQPLSLSASAIPDGPYTYNWTGPNGYIGTGANPLVMPSAAVTDSGSYTVTVTDASGCSGTATVVVSITNCCTLTATAGSNSPQCTGYDLQLTANTQGGSGNFRYSWVGPNGFNSTSQNPILTNVTTAATGSYTLVVTDTSILNCSFTATTSVTISVSPSLTITSSAGTTICSGQSTSLSVGGANGGTVTWRNNLGQIGTGTEIPVQYTNTGTRPLVITYVITSLNGAQCSDTDTVQVVVKPVPTIQIIPPISVVCDIEDVNLRATASVANAAIDWTRTPSIPDPPAAAGIGTGSVGIIQKLPAGSYIFQFTATVNGCTSTQASIPVTVNN